MYRDTEPVTTVSVAYLVLSHDQPHRVEALARRIHELSPSGTVYVHHDAKADDLPWQGHPPDYVHLVEPRVRVSWGRWSLVDATLKSIECARNGSDPDWYVVISGQDWPTRNLAEWEEWLGTCPCDALLEAHRVERSARGTHPERDELIRYQHRWFVLSRPSNAFVRKSTSFVGYALRLVTRPTRTWVSVIRFYGRGWAVGIRRAGGLPPDWRYYKGSQWMALNRHAVATILDNPEHAALADHFRRTLMPDEAYIHTILYNTLELSVVNAPITFVSWAKWRDNLVLDREDIDDIQQAGTPFARKVDPEHDAELLQLIDAMVDARR